MKPPSKLKYSHYYIYSQNPLTYIVAGATPTIFSGRPPEPTWAWSLLPYQTMATPRRRRARRSHSPPNLASPLSPPSPPPSSRPLPTSSPTTPSSQPSTPTPPLSSPYSSPAPPSTPAPPTATSASGRTSAIPRRRRAWSPMPAPLSSHLFFPATSL